MFVPLSCKGIGLFKCLHFTFFIGICTYAYVHFQRQFVDSYHPVIEILIAVMSCDIIIITQCTSLLSVATLYKKAIYTLQIINTLELM